jgi:hypothetical protein
MEVEKFRGMMASLVAAACVVGGGVGAVFVWYLSTTIQPPPDSTLIFGVFTGLIGTGGTYLFITDSASRASHASERSFSSGSASGSTLPEQVVGSAVTGTVTTTATTGANPEPEPIPGDVQPGDGQIVDGG